MKKLLAIFICINLLLPLFAQEVGIEDGSDITEIADSEYGIGIEEGEIVAEDIEEQLEEKPKRPKHRWDFGSNYGVGLDNNMLGFGDIFTKNIVIDAGKLGDALGENGGNLNIGIPFNVLEINVRDFDIGGGKWDFGFGFGTDGNLNINISEALFILLNEGNLNQDSIDGMMSAAGGIYASAGISGAAYYDKFWAGIRPALFTPLVFVPRSGASYHIRTNEDNIEIITDTDLRIYSPIMGIINDGDRSFKMGMDVTLEGGYHFFPFLDVGGSLTNVPLSPAKMEEYASISAQETRTTIKPLDKDADKFELTEFKFDKMKFTSDLFKVHRPFRFDVYARYKPLNTELLVLKPNLGFSVDGNDHQGYFNIGFEGRVNLKDLFMAYIGMGAEEGICRNRLGIALNLRIFEFDLEAQLRSSSFVQSFSSGLGISIGWRFGNLRGKIPRTPKETLPVAVEEVFPETSEEVLEETPEETLIIDE